MNKVKLLFVGPSQAGKTYLTNFLSEAIEQSSSFEYRPTKGVRIIEYETNLVLNSKPVKVDIEFWDVSGDSKYENCWPVIAKNANGVVFVYNQDQSDHDSKLEEWYLHFVQRLRLKDSQCCIIAHKKPKTSDRDVVQLSSNFDQIRSIRSATDELGDQFRDDFNKYLIQLVKIVNETNDLEEQKLLVA